MFSNQVAPAYLHVVDLNPTRNQDQMPYYWAHLFYKAQSYWHEEQSEVNNKYPPKSFNHAVNVVMLWQESKAHFVENCITLGFQGWFTLPHLFHIHCNYTIWLLIDKLIVILGCEEVEALTPKVTWQIFQPLMKVPQPCGGHGRSSYPYLNCCWQHIGIQFRQISSHVLGYFSLWTTSSNT